MKLLFRAIDVRSGQIDFVQRHHDLHMRGCFRVVHGFNCLRHHPIIGRDHENDDVGHGSAACAHGSEGRVTWRIEKSDRLSVPLNPIRADVLRDPASFTGCNARLAHRIHQ